MLEHVKICEVPYTIQLCRDNPISLFVFGDNAMRKGKGGQAIIRDEPNSYGIATKYSAWEYFDDDKKGTNSVVDAEFIISYDILYLGYFLEEGKYDYLYFPKYGLGTGLADLPNKAPKAWEYLCDQLLKYFGFDNKAAYELSKTNQNDRN